MGWIVDLHSVKTGKKLHPKWKEKKIVYCTDVEKSHKSALYAKRFSLSFQA